MGDVVADSRNSVLFKGVVAEDRVTEDLAAEGENAGDMIVKVRW